MLKKTFLHCLLGLRVAAMLSLAAAAATPAFAGAPFSKIAVPGFYRFTLGAFEITALSDGTEAVDVAKLLQNISPQQMHQALARWHQDSQVMFSDNSFLVNTGSKLVLIDTGSGAQQDGATGQMLANLRASGYRPEQVDEIYITHMHGDHIGGLSQAGHMVFPNAVIRAERREGAYWLNQANAAGAPPEAKAGFKQAADELAPYAAAGRYRPFDGAAQLAAGIQAVPIPGHTPGHCAYLVESHGHKLLLVGDLLHVAAVQFDYPAATVPWDTDSKEAAAARIRIFDQAASQDLLIGAAHVSFPGIGHMTRNGKGFDWFPLPYSSN